MHSSLVSIYSQHPIRFKYAEGAYLYDKNGAKYLDMLSGISVTNLGHNHPKLQKVAKEQLDQFWHTSNLFTSELQESLASELCKRSGLDYAFFCNSGTEANEAAIKFARAFHPEKYKIVTMQGGFHGRTLGSLSATAQVHLQQPFKPMCSGFIPVPFNNLFAIEQAIDSETCAVMLEPILGEAGVVLPEKGFLTKLRKLCDSYGILLIMDEVQTGLGRTGTHFCYQWEGIIPDILTLAKGIANGLPLGATLCSEKVNSALSVGDHGSTFGGNPVSVAVAQAVLDELSSDLFIKINQLGAIFSEQLSSLSHVKEIRQKGLMIGVELSVSAKDVAKDLITQGILVGTSGEYVLRLLPPFIVTEIEIERTVNTLKSILKNK